MIQDVQVLPGSASVIDPRMQRIGKVQGNEPITVSLYVKVHEAPPSIPRIAPAPFESRGSMRQSRKIAYRDDFALVSAFARDAGLDVIAVDAGRLLMTLRGPAAAMEVAFGTSCGSTGWAPIATEVERAPLPSPPLSSASFQQS